MSGTMMIVRELILLNLLSLLLEGDNYNWFLRFGIKAVRDSARSNYKTPWREKKR